MNQTNPQTLLKGLQLFEQAKHLHSAKNFAAAADAYRRALTLVPDHPQMLIAYGQLAEDVGDWQGAERIYRRLSLKANIRNIDGKLGMALYNLEQYDEAISLLSTYTTRNPADAAALRFLSTCCFRTKRWDEAILHARQSWAIEKHADAICLEMATWLELGRGDQLTPLVEEALRLFPEHWQVRKLAAEHLLKAGDFQRGFRYFSEFRIPPEGKPHYVEGLPAAWWDGRYFAGTLLIGAEQGIGDEILASSMYGDLVRIGQRAIIEADARLLTILRHAYPALTFIRRDERAFEKIVDDGSDYRKTISGNLGLFFRSESGWTQPRTGWLHADDARVTAFQQRYQQLWPADRRIGISWKSQRALKSGARKDVELTGFAPIFALPGCAFINLQYGMIETDTSALPSPEKLYVDPDVDTMNDMDSLFAQIAVLDLVITTSNVTAHIAGAMGKTCWVILPKEKPVIWYWGYHGDSTPWYPSLRLWRNRRDDDWQDLFASIASALTALPGTLPTPPLAHHAND